MIKWMNDFIGHIDRLPFSVWDGLHIYTWQLVILFACIAALSTWIFHKKRSALIAALSFLILFFVIRDADLIRHKDQQKLIVYNVPQLSGIDLIAGSSCYFAGDSSVITDAFLRNFDIKPSRVKDRVYANNNILLPNIQNIIMTFGTKKILILNRSVHTSFLPGKIPVDIIILSGNAKISIAELQKIFDCKQVVADSRNPSRKCLQWKKDCEQLHLRFHSVTQDGAFALKM
jgi:competence protein ComEC